MSTYDVCLVALPFQNLENPALSLSLLHSCLKSTGIHSKVFYSNLLFADMIGLDKYYLVANGGSYREALVGEFIFSKAAFGGAAPEGYYEFFVKQLEKFVPKDQLQLIVGYLEKIRNTVDDFLEQAVEQVLQTQPKIVAVSSTTQQNCACIAFCRRLKQKSPEAITVVGGPNCERVMGAELARSVDVFDYVISGEADSFWSDFCGGLLQGKRDFSEYPFIFTGEYQLPEAAGFTADLNQMPIPDFDDYFSSLKQYSWQNQVETGLLIESSRGCWWGAKIPCSFCGMNGGSRVFRKKDSKRVVEEFTYYYKKYGITNFFAVDCILAMDFIKEVLPVLQPLGLNIMYEIKTNVTREQLEQLVAAGVRWVQPGIEALQDDLLQMMHKGNRAIKHVELLKHMTELGIRCCWLLLCSFPKDKQSWYADELALIKKIGHLQPPDAIFKLRYDRFSTYQEYPEQYGLKLIPVPAYSYIFPEFIALEKIAYFFKRQEDTTSFYCNDFPGKLYQELLYHVLLWQQSFNSMGAERLEGSVQGEYLEILDLRRCAKKSVVRLNGCIAKLLLKADSVVHRQRCLSELVEIYGKPEVEKALNKLLENGWLIEIGDELLSLVLLHKNTLPPKEVPPSGSVKMMKK